MIVSSCSCPFVQQITLCPFINAGGKFTYLSSFFPHMIQMHRLGFFLPILVHIVLKVLLYHFWFKHILFFFFFLRPVAPCITKFCCCNGSSRFESNNQMADLGKNPLMHQSWCYFILYLTLCVQRLKIEAIVCCSTLTIYT